MNNERIKNLCLDLLNAESEGEVVRILSKEGYWNDSDLWRYYGDKEDNFSTVGNQQSRPEAAIVEKVVNSVDAILMNECWEMGISPDDRKAPKTIHKAVALFFFGDESKYETHGHIGYWSTQKRTEISRRITIAATGSRANPCFSITDSGEGQTPLSMPNTLLDLSHKNKLRVQFVQGKFNMGGTGVLQFCGKKNLQLIISKRNPKVVTYSPDESSDLWGFTIVRRENPISGRRSSVYTYLAPLNAKSKPGKGELLRFNSKKLPIFPERRNAYSRESEWGTLIKLYDYAATGFRTNMMMRDGLLFRLDILLPEIALPLRLYECRDYRGHEGSFETTLTGLSVRLEDNKAENLEDGFPTASSLTARGERMSARIYAFKKGKANTYRKREGIVFTVNGQTHGHLPLSFFSRRSVGMGRLDDSILVSIDCSNLSGRAREDLFMNSRDRLRSGDLRDEIEYELEIMIRDHQGLKDLRERRRREEIEEKVGDSKPLEEALESILKSSPSLISIFLGGTRLPNPFKTKEVSYDDQKYEGKLHPTYFKFLKKPYGENLERKAAINMRCRITFETDVVNDYFDRLENRGNFSLEIAKGNQSKQVDSYSLNLQNGIATLNIKLPGGCSIGDIIKYKSIVSDDTLLEPFINSFSIQVCSPQNVETGGEKRRRPPSKKEGKQREIMTKVAMPEIHRVYESGWDSRKQKFDKFSALEIVQESSNIDDAGDFKPPIYSFWVNMDNIFLKAEIKSRKDDPKIIKAKFTYGLVLIGLALLQEDMLNERKRIEKKNRKTGENNEITIEQQVYQTSKAIAPVILPLIESLGGLTEEELSIGSQRGDDE
ncbi:MAG: hypothetical protein R6V27_09540 [Balneolaceae bacterium]